MCLFFLTMVISTAFGCKYGNVLGFPSTVLAKHIKRRRKSYCDKQCACQYSEHDHGIKHDDISSVSYRPHNLPPQGTGGWAMSSWNPPLGSLLNQLPINQVVKLWCIILGYGHETPVSSTLKELDCDYFIKEQSFAEEISPYPRGYTVFPWQGSKKQNTFCAGIQAPLLRQRNSISRGSNSLRNTFN